MPLFELHCFSTTIIVFLIEYEVFTAINRNYILIIRQVI